ncbi:MAG: C25 family cysteine peptidase [bacterium]|nr:C25 family cysteine peptidase [bacterium]
MDFSSYTGCTLTFYAWQSSNYDDYLVIGVVTQGGGVNDPTWTSLGYLYQSGSNWDGWYADLSAYDGQPSVVIGFDYYTATPDQNSVGVDYVTVIGIGGGTPDIYVTPESLYYYYEGPSKVAKVNGYWNDREVCVKVNVPDFKVESLEDGTQKVNIAGFGHLGKIGAPYLPAKIYTVAIPPGAVVKSVDVTGTRNELPGTYNIMPTPPSLPLNDYQEIVAQLMEQYNANKDKFYSSTALYPAVIGELRGTGGLRRYNLVDVAIYPFTYQPVSKKLYYTHDVTITIRYTMDSKKKEESMRLLSDNLADDAASEVIYNYSQAREWYGNIIPAKQTYDYVIITTQANTGDCATLVNWKTSLGYSVNVVTKEWINTNYTGNDIQQKIRNFLRDKYPSSQWGIKYVLIVGDNNNIPMRICTPYNNDPDGPMNDPQCSPIPTDLYYAELTAPDNTSWNSDGDSYYGEVWGQNHEPPGDDRPDYHADIHLGRIPWSDGQKIRHICDKIVAFEQNTDLTYKKMALLAGGILFFANENGNPNIPFYDGAKVMEDLMDNGVIERANAAYLYEKEGLSPSPHSCTAPLTEQNTINYWSNRGIFNEFNHGANVAYYRKVWAWDNGNNIPEDAEMQWPEAFSTSCAPLVDDIHPAIGFLMSCLCGYPETLNNLGAALLYQGCASIIAATRVSWGTGENWDYYFFENLLKDTSTTHAKVGDAFDAGRNEYVTNLGFEHWLNLYDFVLYGDPALYHFGAVGGEYLSGTMRVHNNGDGVLNVSNISHTQNWIVSTNPSSFSVSPGDSCGVTVLVNPKGLPQGVYRDTLKITSNDPDEGMYPVKVVLRVGVTGVEEDDIISKDKSTYVMLDNYPDPFTHNTAIRVQGVGVSEKDRVGLQIYDLSGRLVKSFTLPTNHLSLTAAVSWDGKDDSGRKVATGVYFIKLIVDNHSKATDKVILLK